MLNFLKSRALHVFIAIMFIAAGLSYVVPGKNPGVAKLSQAGTNQVIAASIAKPKVEEFVHGRTNIVRNKDVDIWYEVIRATPNPVGTIVLIMGVGGTAINWPEHFYMPLVAAGYQVIRMDNRGVGMSSWMPNWSFENSYSLLEMASDVVSILDQERVEKAHIVGMSMGGMIAQELGLLWPSRVESLTLMGTSANFEVKDAFIYGNYDYTDYMIRQTFGKSYPKGTEEYAIRAVLALMKYYVGDGDYEVDVDRVSQMVLYELRERRGFNKLGRKQHLMAIKNSGSRLGRLDQLTVPTLVVHGEEDPIMPISEAQYYASLIPGADTLWVDGLGHSIPEEKMSVILPKVMKHIHHNNIKQDIQATQKLKQRM